MTRGWLFDTYPVGNKMISWIKNENSIKRIEDVWTPSIYVASDCKLDLEKLSCNEKIMPYVVTANFTQRFEKVSDRERSQVLQLQLKDSNHILELAKIIDYLYPLGKFRLYNVDIPSTQSYFYEQDLFPFGRFIKNDFWQSIDDVTSTDYDVPDLKIVNLSVIPQRQGRIAKFSDKINSIVLDKTTLCYNDESETILALVNEIQNQDPDFIITQNGDTFDLPYLAYRSQECCISSKVVLGRENVSLRRPTRTGTSYFSYGKMYFKPSSIKLFGRIHLDIGNCFIWTDENDMHGLFEIARVCRMPMQTASRASIGKCMSSIQFYNATKRGLLIPWKPIMAESFKSRNDLLLGDRGGLIFEPEMGVYENVAELDFISLYGSIMEKKNISAETILCKCCHDSENKVPELNYNICQRIGIVPQSLQLLLGKKTLYGKLLENPTDEIKSKIYSARNAALKWILVTSFGYLGFNNAKFGRIDAHMAVCAFARQILLKAVRIAECHGFKILHGIVDSLWLYKIGSTVEDYKKIQDEIIKITGFDISLDIYKWLVFLPSKEHEMLAVANRYFGAFENGDLKVRGMELRRHDTPLFFKKCQKEILELMATANNVSKVKSLMPLAVKIYEKYLQKLKEHDVSVEELSFTNRSSKDVDEYNANSIQKDVMLQLKKEGESIKAGQKIRYVITDYKRKRNRSVPLSMAGSSYDVNRYTQLLIECCLSITKPFGMTSDIFEHKTNSLLSHF